MEREDRPELSTGIGEDIHIRRTGSFVIHAYWKWTATRTIHTALFWIRMHFLRAIVDRGVMSATSCILMVTIWDRIDGNIEVACTMTEHTMITYPRKRTNYIYRTGEAQRTWLLGGTGKTRYARRLWIASPERGRKGRRTST